MQAQIVVGLAFGDEGKGLTTDYLCLQNPRSLVVRFSGGHQAGHTVVTSDGKRHVFSSFGSGSLRGIPTYWSSSCVFYPIAMVKEYDALKEQGVIPILYVDALTMVTTPFDVGFNRALEFSRSRHGSCGVGVGTTLERNEKPYKLYVQDLQFPWVLQQKLEAIKKYYEDKVSGSGNGKLKEYYYSLNHEAALQNFIRSVERARQIMEIVNEDTFVSSWPSLFDNIIFEGSQGILLDMDFGFFPHVTRSHVSSRNAMAFCKRHKELPDTPEIYYVSRCYQTRHGAGYMTNEHLPVILNNNANETNILNDWQGYFRTAVLDIDLLNYALCCDRNYTSGTAKSIVITCLDQIDNFQATKEGRLIKLSNSRDLLQYLDISKDTIILESFSDCAENIRAQ